MKKVIFICKGNMHRSVVAMALYNVLKKDDSFATSYGTMVEAEGRTGRKESSYSSLLVFIDALKKLYGVDISNHVCTQVTPEVLEGADKIVVMAEEEFIPDWLREYKYTKWELPDPDPRGVSEDIEGIKKKVESLLK
jgi:protein-tyrosine-phosphatase